MCLKLPFTSAASTNGLHRYSGLGIEGVVGVPGSDSVDGNVEDVGVVERFGGRGARLIERLHNGDLDQCNALAAEDEEQYEERQRSSKTQGRLLNYEGEGREALLSVAEVLQMGDRTKWYTKLLSRPGQPAMMKTRRKSKAAAAAAVEAATAASTRENSPAPAPAPLAPGASISVAIPEDVDADILSNLLPDVDLSSPSSDVILSLYRLVVAQATESDATQRELEEARADIERKDVELDQALQDRDYAASELESTLDSVRKELEQVKQEKEELGTSCAIAGAPVSRAALQAQLTSLSTTQSVSSSEVESLKHRVEDTEREKRDLVTVVSRMKEDSVQREG
ncbi:predicted protein [Postia placenta Mad-698-R]|nr:predicted protein [Postia placenta Mad-698-R]